MKVFPFKKAIAGSTEKFYDSLAPVVDQWKWKNFWQTYEYPLVRKWVNQCPGGVLLNAGCGTGDYLKAYCDAFSHIIGVDFSQGMLEKAQEKIKGQQNKFTLQKADIASMGIESKSVQAIISNRVFSLIEHPKPVFEEFYRVLENGGNLCISDIHPQHPYASTHIKVEEKEYYFNTYKHNLSRLMAQAYQSGFREISVEEVHLSNLNPPPNPIEFEKFYSLPEPYIFYILTAKKNEKN